MVIELTKGELIATALAGAFRQARGLAEKDAHNFVGDGWAIHINGVGAEIAVARALNVYHDVFSPSRDRTTGDVAGLGVRSTPHAEGHLIVYRADPPGIYVLAVGAVPRYRVAGWIEKADACQGRWWNAAARDPSFWVPQAALASLDLLHLEAA